MPLSHALRDDAIWITAEGDVEFASGIVVLEHSIQSAQASDPTVRWHFVFDIRASVEDRSANELRGIAQFIADRLQVLSGRCVVIAGDNFHYGLSRMFQAYGEGLGLSTQVVKTASEATAWLERADPDSGAG